MRASRERPISIGSLHQVGGEGLTHPLDANTFVITGEHPVLIECGSVHGYKQLKQRLRKLDLGVEDIKVVLASHGDFDHVSGYALMSEESDAELLVPTGDRVAVESGDNILTEAVFYGETAKPMRVAGEVDDGFCLRLGEVVIRAIHTPWHTQGSVCYRIDQPDSSTLIGADTLYGWYFLNRMRNPQDDIEQGRESLRRLRAERGLTHVAIGHSMRGMRPNVSERLEEAERQFAPTDLAPMIEEAIEQSRPYVDPWIKLPGETYRY